MKHFASLANPRSSFLRLTRSSCMAAQGVHEVHKPRAGANKLLLVVGVALVDRQSSPPKVLLAQRPPGKANPGLWEFPGGKIDPGETPEHALSRELKEELGITVLESDLVPLSFASHAYPTFHLLMPLFVCTRWEGQAVGAEGQAIVWATEDEVLQGGAHDALQSAAFPLTAADVPLVGDVVRALRSNI